MGFHRASCVNLSLCQHFQAGYAASGSDASIFRSEADINPARQTAPAPFTRTVFLFTHVTSPGVSTSAAIDHTSMNATTILTDQIEILPATMRSKESGKDTR